MSDRADVALLAKNLLFTVAVPGTVAGWIPYWIAGDRPIAPGVTWAIAAAAFATGASIYAWCVWNFASFGRGTPAPPDAPKRLVVRGPYRYSRNPMYGGVLLFILGWAILFRSLALLAYALAVLIAFQCFILGHEEPHLRRGFGSEYEAYRARVGRWWPRCRRLQRLSW